MRSAPLKLIAVLAASAAFASPVRVSQRLVAADTGVEAWFGSTLAADGPYLAVGVQRVDFGIHGPGGAVYTYLHKRDGWSFEQRIANPDYQDRPSFGRAVALGGSLLAVGDPWTKFYAGVVYLYQRDESGWRLASVINSPDGPWSRDFGDALALDGRTLAIRARHHAGNGAFDSVLYLFDVSAPTAPILETRLLAPSGQSDEPFAECFDVSGDDLAVSSRLAGHHGQWSGAAFTYHRDREWSEPTVLFPSQPQTWAQFGCPLQLRSERLVVGSPHYSGADPASGAAFVFERETGGQWLESAMLVPADPVAQDWFPASLALRDDRLVAGVWRKGIYGLYSGAAYVFDRSPKVGWAQTQRLLPPSGFEDMKFGYATGLGERTVLVGAPSDIDRGVRRGAIYAFSLSHLEARR